MCEIHCTSLKRHAYTATCGTPLVYPVVVAMRCGKTQLTPPVTRRGVHLVWQVCVNVSHEQHEGVRAFG